MVFWMYTCVLCAQYFRTLRISGGGTPSACDLSVDSSSKLEGSVEDDQCYLNLECCVESCLVCSLV